MSHISFIRPSLQPQVMACLRKPIYPPPEPSDYEDEDDMPKPWPHPPELDNDFWTVLEYIFNETVQRLQTEDFTTHLVVDPKIAPAATRLIQFLAPEPKPGEDEFEPWGRWHRGTSRLMSNLNWIARMHGDLAEGLEFGSMALGDWSWYGFMDCMREARRHELANAEGALAPAAAPDGADPDGEATQDTSPSP